MSPHSIAPTHGKTSLDAALQRLAPSLSRMAAETAGAFLSAEAVPATDWTVVPRLPDLGLLRSSQKNMGDKHELICNLAVEKTEWERLFGAGAGEEFCLDAFCEMANCICGSLLADPAFTDEFGHLIPCVPYAGYGRPAPGSRSHRGAFRLGGAWIHFSLSMHETANLLAREAVMVA